MERARDFGNKHFLVGDVSRLLISGRYSCSMLRTFFVCLGGPNLYLNWKRG